MRKDVINRLVALREKAGLTAHEVSKRLRRSRFYISRLENGVSFPSVKDLEEILAIYNCTLEKLFFREFEEFDFCVDTIEKLRVIGKKEKDTVLGVLSLAYEKSKESKEEKVI